MDEAPIIVLHGLLGLLGDPPQVGRELEAVDSATAVPHQQDGINRVKDHVVQHGSLPVHNRLDANRRVTIHTRKEGLQTSIYILYIYC
jgi:hypothetical protein